MNEETPVARIYCIRNKVNGLLYIGATRKSIEERFNYHMKRKQQQYRKVNLFTQDIIKYGRENFTIELIENVYDPEIIAEVEDYWISKFSKDKLYNIAKSAYSSKMYNCDYFGKKGQWFING